MQEQTGITYSVRADDLMNGSKRKHIYHRDAMPYSFGQVARDLLYGIFDSKTSTLHRTRLSGACVRAILCVAGQHTK